MAFSRHTYCKPNYFQMLVGDISMKLKDGKKIDEIIQSSHIRRRYGTVDVLKAVDMVNSVRKDIDMNHVAGLLELEYRPNDSIKTKAKKQKANKGAAVDTTASQDIPAL